MSGGEDCLIALYSVAARCSCASFAPGVPDRLRLLHAKLRSKLASQLTKSFEDVESRLSKRDARRIARSLLATHLLRCYTALLSDATASLSLELKRHVQPAGTAPEVDADPAPGPAQQRPSPPSAPPDDHSCMSPHRRLVRTLSDLLEEAVDVLWFFKEVAVHYDTPDCPSPERTSSDLGAELVVSGFLELCSRGLLLLAACEGCGRKAADLLALFVTSVHATRNMLGAISGLLASYPSLSFLLSAHVAQLVGALAGGGAVGGLPPSAVPWSAPLLLRAGGGATAAASGSNPRPLDFNDPDGGSSITLASLALGLWEQVCNIEVLGPVPPWMSSDTCADGAGGSSLPPTLPAPGSGAVGPPRLLSQTFAGHLRQLEELLASLERIQADSGLEGTESVEVQRPPTTERCTEVTRQARIEAARLRRLVATVTSVPPLNAVATVGLCLGLLAAAWGSLTSGGGGGAGRHKGGLPQGRLQLRLTRGAASLLSRDALACSKAAVSFMSDLAARAELPRRAVQQLEACWRDWLAWAGLKAGSRGPEVAAALEGWDWHQVGKQLALPSVSGSAALPVEPSAPMAAAIAAGYLSGLGWMLRRLSAPDHSQIQISDFLQGLNARDDTGGSWKQLLAFTPRHEVASFVDALAGLVELTALQLPEGALGNGSGGGCCRGGSGAPAEPGNGLGSSPGGRLCQCVCGATTAAVARDGVAEPVDKIVYDVSMLLLGALQPILSCCLVTEPTTSPKQAQEQRPTAAEVLPDGGEEGGQPVRQAAGAGGRYAGAPVLEAQLGAAVSYIAVRLLPRVAELLLRMRPAVRVNRDVGGHVARAMRQMLPWMNLMAAAAAEPGAGAPAEAAEPAVSGTAESAHGAAAASELVPPASATADPSSSSSTAVATSPPLSAAEAGKTGSGAELWADVLFRDMDAFSFLRAAIAMRRVMGTAAVPIKPILDTTIALAALFPRQLGAALAEEAGPLAAAPASANAGQAGDDYSSLWDGVRWVLGERIFSVALSTELGRLRDWAAMAQRSQRQGQHEDQEQLQQQGPECGGDSEAGQGTAAPSPPLCAVINGYYAQCLMQGLRASAEALINPVAARMMQRAPGPGLSPGPSPPWV